MTRNGIPTLFFPVVIPCNPCTHIYFFLNGSNHTPLAEGSHDGFKPIVRQNLESGVELLCLMGDGLGTLSPVDVDSCWFEGMSGE